MKTLSTYLIIILFTGVFVTKTSAQEWSSEQMEVLKATQTLYEYWANRNLESYMSSTHKDFSGWFGNEPLPVNKNLLQKWEGFWLKDVKVLIWEIQPVSITVSGDVAVIHHFLITVREDEKGKSTVSSKYTDVYKKENGKWMNIASCGGKITEN
ncbi:MAG: hypothetical protein A2066_13125 [Bacteroidetes bacterium GWB2_41_8]|nr:MAG: hypothetical protein A2066_13125 [Bacteroidetes bacterium GWB2_41_8]